MLGLIVRNALGPIKLGQPGFDFGQKYEPFNSIVDGGIGRHRLESLDNAVASKWLLHGLIVNTFRGRWNYVPNDRYPRARTWFESAEERCLARPVGTDQSDFFARIQLKRSIHEEQLLAILLIDV